MRLIYSVHRNMTKNWQEIRFLQVEFSFRSGNTGDFRLNAASKACDKVAGRTMVCDAVGGWCGAPRNFRSVPGGGEPRRNREAFEGI
jgi:hypothetical protein